MTAELITHERRWEDCVSNRQVRRKRPSMGNAFFVVGGVVLALHHVWVAVFRQDPELEVLWVGCFLMVLNAMGWIAPTLVEGVEGRAKMRRWQGFLWMLVFFGLGALLSWSVGRFVYGVNLFA